MADMKNRYHTVRNMKAEVSTTMDMKVRIIFEMLSIIKKYAKQRLKHNVDVRIIK